MEQPVLSPNPRKRLVPDLDCTDCEEVSAKRACSESSSASPHLSLLEELCDFDGEEEGPAMEAPLESSPQEDLVAEMMRSLERVIGGEESRVEGEASTSKSDSFESSLALDFSWGSEDVDLPCDVQDEGFQKELVLDEELKENAQIKQLLQASDDELGLSLSSSSSDLEELAFRAEWASLDNESSASGNMNWLDLSMQSFDDAPALLNKEMFEPLLLF